VPYKGAAPAMTDIQGGQVDLLCDQITTTLQPIESGRVKAYGTTSRSHLPSLPQLQTLSEQGLPNFEVTVWHGIYAPKGIPKDVSARLVKALQDAVTDPQFKQNLLKLGALPVSKDKATPEALEAQLKSEINRWTPIIKASAAYLD
jgi:tripartite-type tricarboxylate transporter receptor subunit TctC